MTYSRIAGTGSYLPERVVDNHEFAKRLDTSDAWIRERTGIVQRHIAAEGQASSDLALEACDSSAMCRRSIPVRSRIQASLVSRRRANSSFSITRCGR